jgi:carbon monoxide dehydrogenase subunit G
MFQAKGRDQLISCRPRNVPNGKSIPIDFRGSRSSAGSMNSNTQVEVVIHNNGSSQVSGSAGGALGRELESAVTGLIANQLRTGGLINQAIRQSR